MVYLTCEQNWGNRNPDLGLWKQNLSILFASPGCKFGDLRRCCFTCKIGTKRYLFEHRDCQKYRTCHPDQIGLGHSKLPQNSALSARTMEYGPPNRLFCSTSWLAVAQSFYLIFSHIHFLDFRFSLPRHPPARIAVLIQNKRPSKYKPLKKHLHTSLRSEDRQASQDGHHKWI